MMLRMLPATANSLHRWASLLGGKASRQAVMDSSMCLIFSCMVFPLVNALALIFGRMDASACLGLGGYIIEGFEGGGNEGEDESGYCCQQFDVSKLEDGGCDKLEFDANSVVRKCGDVVDDSNGLSILVESDGTGAGTTVTEYCCPSGILFRVS
jgi:hypothetical protein